MAPFTAFTAQSPIWVLLEIYDLVGAITVSIVPPANRPAITPITRLSPTNLIYDTVSLNVMIEGWTFLCFFLHAKLYSFEQMEGQTFNQRAFK